MPATHLASKPNHVPQPFALHYLPRMFRNQPQPFQNPAALVNTLSHKVLSDILRDSTHGMWNPNPGKTVLIAVVVAVWWQLETH